MRGDGSVINAARESRGAGGTQTRPLAQPMDGTGQGTIGEKMNELGTDKTVLNALLKNLDFPLHFSTQFSEDQGLETDLSSTSALQWDLSSTSSLSATLNGENNEACFP